MDPVLIQQFTEILSPLCCTVRKDQLLPKYCYPSAGSLYSIQTYVVGVSNEESQTFYLHPEQHSLIPVPVSSEATAAFRQNTIVLVAKLSPYVEAYGTLGVDFAFLEAGTDISILSSIELKIVRICSCSLKERRYYEI